MNDKKWYKTWWIWVITIIVIALIVSIPIIINESYKTNKGYITLWGAEDVLSYAATIMSVIGSLILGIVAIRLNKNANEISKMAFKQSEDLFNIQKTEYMPVLNVQNLLGISKFKMTTNKESLSENIIIFEGRTKENYVE